MPKKKTTVAELERLMAKRLKGYKLPRIDAKALVRITMDAMDHGEQIAEKMKQTGEPLVEFAPDGNRAVVMDSSIGNYYQEIGGKINQLCEAAGYSPEVGEPLFQAVLNSHLQALCLRLDALGVQRHIRE